MSGSKVFCMFPKKSLIIGSSSNFLSFLSQCKNKKYAALIERVPVKSIKHKKETATTNDISIAVSRGADKKRLKPQCTKA